VINDAKLVLARRVVKVPAVEAQRMLDFSTTLKFAFFRT
jgi:hypothetical protein